MIEIVKGDITEQDTDAIVNAANRELVGGGGVDGAIWHAAGHDNMMRACNEIGHCEVGQAVVTPGFNLKAKWVIHTVGPVWVGTPGADHPHHIELMNQLASCYKSSLAVGHALGCRSIAFPAISTGVFRFPPDIAAGIAFAVVEGYERMGVTILRDEGYGDPIELIRLVAYDDATYDLYRRCSR